MNEKIKNNLETLATRVISEIKQENISMHSRLYFMFRTSLWVLAIVFIFAATLYLVSLITFIISGNALGGLAFFGMRGFVIMLHSLPWLLILAVASLILLLEFLSSHFRFMYKRPFVYSLLAFLTILIVGGTLLAKTTLHKRAFKLTESYNLPIAAPLYHGYALRHSEHMHIGVIEQIVGNEILITTRDGNTVTILIQKSTKRPSRVVLEDGMTVMVVGKKDGTTIIAEGIRPLERGKTLFSKRHQKGYKKSKMK